MNFFTQWSFSAKKVRSLDWVGDTLIDWVNGGDVYELDGTFHRRQTKYDCSHCFNAVKVSPSGLFAVIYEQRGTKGSIVNHAGETIRQIDRDPCHADDYNYPIALFALPDGREGIVHCPDSYCQLEIEELLTGEKLTYNSQRQADDIFYSNLEVHPNNRYLLNNGWVWSPSDIVNVYDLPQVLNNPSLLDDRESILQISPEFCHGTFGIDSSVIIVDSEIEDEEDENKERQATNPSEYSFIQTLYIYDIQTREYRSSIRIEEAVYQIMPVSDRYILGFDKHPKLIDLTTGKVVWSLSNITVNRSLIALDVKNSRFAVASESEIAIVQIDRLLDIEKCCRSY